MKLARAGTLGLFAATCMLAVAAPSTSDLGAPALDAAQSPIGQAQPAGDVAAMQKGLAEVEALFRQALELAEREQGPDHPMTINAARQLGHSLVEQRKYVEAEWLLHRALAGYARDAQARPPTPPLPLYRATTAVDLGLALYGQKRYAAAELQLVEALEMLAPLSEVHDSWPEHAHLFLGDSLTNQGRPAEGEPHLRLALELATKRRERDDPGLALVLWYLGKALAEREMYAQAQVVLRQALAIHEARAADALSPQGADIAVALGGVLAKQGKAPEAEPLLRRSLDFAQTRIGLTDIVTQNIARELARSLRDQGRAEAAAELLRRHGIDPATDQPAPGVHPDSLMWLASRASERHLSALPADARQDVSRAFDFYMERRFDESASDFGRALQRAEQTLGTAHPATALVEVYLADALIEQHRYAQGETRLRRALAVQQTFLARQGEHPEITDRLIVVRSWQRLGLALYGQRKRADAVSAFRNGLDLADELGRDDPGTATSRMFLGETLYAERSYLGAEDQFRRALATLAKYHVSEDADVHLRAQTGVAVSVFERRHYGQAVPLLERAIAQREGSSAYGPRHRTTIDLTWALGVSLHHSGQLAQAETTFRQGLAVAEEALGRRDELTVSFLNWLGINLRAQQRPSDALTYFSQALEATPSEAPQAAARAGIAINRAGVLESLGRPQEAALDYRFAADLLDGLEARQQTHLQEALQGLVRALEAAGMGADAQAARRRLQAVQPGSSQTR